MLKFAFGLTLGLATGLFATTGLMVVGIVSVLEDNPELTQAINDKLKK